ncbi:phospholipase [Leptospira hartskeerlii]|uniref:Phospholipase n=1 Tax=Leptospira hartskeerlii TaxID=2023177 RepID=A0A2M9XDN5_9LEPT|nr:phospholipase [Leptospira hartskeerlii]PJZ25682.1 phospholipase [Leptospira hartskeerlii]PJZ35495.1 phospholipase [Leptospira hartskeerlii]
MESAQIFEPGAIALLFNLYGYYIFFILFALWTPLAVVDLAGRTDLSVRAGSIWTVIVILVPLLGAAAYHIAGGSQVPVRMKSLLVSGGFLLLFLTIMISTIV